jgi:hypothetical protein
MLIQALKEKSASPSAAARFTSSTGLLYLAFGLGICAIPALVPVLFFEPTFQGREEGLLRLSGFIMAVVGWFFWIGGRTGARAFVAATIIPRLVVPAPLVFLATTGVFPHFMYAMAALDPALALVAWRRMSHR